MEEQTRSSASAGEQAAPQMLSETASSVERLRAVVQQEPRSAAGVIAFWLSRGE